MTDTKPPITLTPAAVERLKEIVSKAEGAVIALRISVNKKGCNGLGYELSYVEEADDKDIKIEQDGTVVYLDPAASLYLYGSTMDFVTEKLRSACEFINPNEKSRCGCGESFNV